MSLLQTTTAKQKRCGMDDRIHLMCVGELVLVLKERSDGNPPPRGVL